MTNLTGNDDDNILTGTGADDVIIGMGGDDSLSGLAGDDIITGGFGNDDIQGGDGNDILAGEAGDDLLDGGAGQDLLAPGGGNDVIVGGAGRDIVALSGVFEDYLFLELTAPDGTAPGIYRVEDQRSGTPDGINNVTGVEVFRFSSGPEVTLAQALNRDPTDILITRTPASGAQVLENALSDSFVARLETVDPDEGDEFTYKFATVNGVSADAEGRFVLRGSNLMVAKQGAFDFDKAATHAVTIEATDSSGNKLIKAFTIAVRDSVDVFSALSFSLPAGATNVQLWDQQDSGYIVTWTAPSGADDAIFARRIDEAGLTVAPAGGPPPADRKLADVVQPQDSRDPQVKLLGVDDNGVAAIVTENANSQQPAGGFDSHDDIVRWINVASGQTESSQTFANSSNGSSLSSGEFPFDSHSSSFQETRVDQFAFDDNFVIYLKSLRSGSDSYSGTGYSNSSSSGSSASDIQLHSLNSAGQDKLIVSGGDQRSQSSSSSSFGSSSQLTSVSQEILGFDIAESGQVIAYSLRSTTSQTDGNEPQGSSSLSLTIDQNNKFLSAPTSYGLAEVALHNSTNYALAYIALEGERSVVLDFNQSGGSARVNIESTSASFNFELSAFGTDRYLLTFVDLADPDGPLKAQVFDLFGNALTERLSFGSDTSFVTRDNGTVTAYSTSTAADGSVTVEGQVALSGSVLVTPSSGAFLDNDGDGDLDFTGTITIGHAKGEESILRLEGGTYELTLGTLKVHNATVFAAIGDQTEKALFVGSFDLNRANGTTSNFVVTTPTDAFNPAGLVATYSGLTLRADSAALGAKFAVPFDLFGSDAQMDLTNPNGLLINGGGPMLDGFEVKLPPFKFGPGAGDPTKYFTFNLFTAESKGLTVRYDTLKDEFAISGELKITSDIVEGLAKIGGAQDVAFTFKDFKIKDGKYDFAGELSAKSWKIGKFELKDLKFGLVVDDNVLTTVDVAAGFALPFAQLNGLSFAGQVLRPPLELNKLTLAAETTIKLPYGLFIDKISATIDNFAGSPPEPVSIPTTLSGTLGIGWGPKIPSFTLPEFLGIDEVQQARFVNAELTLSSDFSTMVSATGTINLYQDAVAKHTGSITWDWQKGAITLVGAADYFSGVGTGNTTLKLTTLGLTQSGILALAIPNAPVFSFLAGFQIASANSFNQILLDGDASNDFFATWGQVNVPVIGTLTVGFKFDFNTAQFSLITGANDIPKTNSFDVDGTEDWLMISAVWENDAGGDVLTRMRTPEGTFIAEADYAANGIMIIDEFTGGFTKTVVIDDPRAGNWDLQVIDTTGLGAVSYKGFSPNAPVTVEVTSASAGLGEAEGQITALLAGVDPGTMVSFWADDNLAGLDGFALASATVDADGSVSVDFPTALLSGGTWFIYAVADDNHGAPASNYFAAPITVGHRPTGIEVDAWTPPVGPDAQARVEATDLPGTVVGDLSAVTTDFAETHSFTLLDDAGGRFVIDGERLLVSSGAPLDSNDGSYLLAVRITTGAGLTFDTTIAVEISRGDPGHRVQAGTAALADVLLGTDSADSFYEVEPGDVVAGGNGNDGLWLAGNRADYALVLDPDGSITGPVFAFPNPPGFDFPNVASPLDPVAPFLRFIDLRAPESDAIVASGLEFVQFLDERISVAGLFDPEDPVDPEDPIPDFIGTDGEDRASGRKFATWYALGLGGDDKLTGGNGNDKIDGGSGNDTLKGGNGDDLLIGGEGDDLLKGINGNDTLQGGGGADQLEGGGGDDILEGGAGDDFLKGASGNDIGKGGDGADLLDGGGGDDVLLGEDGDDTLLGGGGNDYLSGGIGADNLDGGGGDDELHGGDGGDLVVGGGGDDRLYGEDGDDYLKGGGKDDILDGGAGQDQLFGGSGDDTLSGGDDDDTLFGENGRDQLVGGNGNDTLVGGKFSDTLTGGTGTDVFLYLETADSRKGAQADVITDFETGIDLIDIAAIGSGAGTAIAWLGTAAFVKSGAAQLRAILDENGNTLIQLDIDGNGRADMEIVLLGQKELTSGDFVL